MVAPAGDWARLDKPTTQLASTARPKDRKHVCSEARAFMGVRLSWWGGERSTCQASDRKEQDSSRVSGGIDAEGGVLAHQTNTAQVAFPNQISPCAATFCSGFWRARHNVRHASFTG